MSLNSTTGGLFLLPPPLYALPKKIVPTIKFLCAPKSPSVDPSMCNVEMKLRSKNCYTVSSQSRYASVFLSRTSGPVVARFNYQHLCTRSKFPIVPQLNNPVTAP